MKVEDNILEPLVDRLVQTSGYAARRAAERARLLAEAAGPDGVPNEGELSEVAPETNPQGDNWHPGGAPSQSLTWAAQAVAQQRRRAAVGVGDRRARDRGGDDLHRAHA